MARFTDEQLRFGQAMKLMIDLYYQLKALDPELIKVGDLSAAWYSEALILRMADIFNLTVPNFSPCLYFVESSSFRYRGERETISVTRGGLTNFIEAMEALTRDVSRKITVCFKLIEIITLSHEQVGRAGGQKGTTLKNANPAKDYKLKCVVVPNLDRSAASPKEHSAYLEKKQLALNKVPSIMDSFVLGHHDSGLDDVVSTNYNLDGSDREPDRIFCPGFSVERSSFFDVITYLLIKYQWLFGSFERVKVCKQCDKLFFEKRLGAREFCSGLCRKHYNDSLQVPEKRLCRERQNQWIFYQYNNISGFPKVYRLQKDDCDKCNGVTPSGKCPALMKKNPKVLKLLKKHSK